MPAPTEILCGGQTYVSLMKHVFMCRSLVGLGTGYRFSFFGGGNVAAQCNIQATQLKFSNYFEMFCYCY